MTFQVRVKLVRRGPLRVVTMTLGQAVIAVVKVPILVALLLVGCDGVTAGTSDLGHQRADLAEAPDMAVAEDLRAPDDLAQLDLATRDLATTQPDFAVVAQPDLAPEVDLAEPPCVGLGCACGTCPATQPTGPYAGAQLDCVDRTIYDLGSRSECCIRTTSTNNCNGINGAKQAAIRCSETGGWLYYGPCVAP